MKNEMSKLHRSKSDLFLFLIVACMLMYQYFSKGGYPRVISSFSAILTGFIAATKILLLISKSKGYFSKKSIIDYTVFTVECGICLLLSFLYFYCQNRPDLLMGLLISIALLDASISLYIRYIGYISVIYYGIHLGLYSLGFITDHVDPMPRLKNGEIIYRYAIGFDHPNYTACFILLIVAAAICSNKVFDRRLFICSSLIFSVISYLYTDSRTAIAVSLVGMFLCYNRILLSKINLYYFVIITLFGSLIITAAISVLFRANSSVNFLFSQRPRIMYELIADGIPMLGNPSLKRSYLSGMSIDSFTFNLLFGYGIIITLSIFFLIIYMAKSAEEYNNRYLCMVIILYLVYGLTENHVLDYGFSIISPIMFIAIFNSSFFELDM